MLHISLTWVSIAPQIIRYYLCACKAQRPNTEGYKNDILCHVQLCSAIFPSKFMSPLLRLALLLLLLSSSSSSSLSSSWLFWSYCMFCGLLFHCDVPLQSLHLSQTPRSSVARACGLLPFLFSPAESFLGTKL